MPRMQLVMWSRTREHGAKSPSRRASRAIGSSCDRRHRWRHSRVGRCADLRAVFHDQGDRTRHGTGTIYCAQRCREGPRRLARFRDTARQGHHVLRAPAFRATRLTHSSGTLFRPWHRRVAARAAFRAGRQSLARALVGGRLALKSRSEFNRSLLDRLLVSGGDENSRAA